MRSLILFLSFFVTVLFFKISLAQDYSMGCDMPEFSGGTEVLPIQYKGMYITSTGTLRVLVVFIRFADDDETSSIWPDPDVKPAWIQNFVNSTYSPTGNYYSGTVSDYFYKNSYGNYHVIGDVYYVTLPQGESYYHEYAYNHSTTSARGLIEMEALNIIDSSPYNVDFNLYDNWKYLGFPEKVKFGSLSCSVCNSVRGIPYPAYRQAGSKNCKHFFDL